MIVVSAAIFRDRRMAIRRESKSWIEGIVSQLVLDAPENRLRDFGDQHIFDAPLVGIADGDDALFNRFRAVVSPRHMLPREALRAHCPDEADLSCVRVLAWALPFAEAIRRSNRGRRWPSKLYSLARNNGGALNHRVRQRLTEMLRGRGWAAVAPVLTQDYDTFRSPEHAFSSTWSERHVAYAAGLGQFGLNGALITPLGINVRLGSVVTNMPVDPTPRPYDDYRAPCLKSRAEVCGACMERCPVGAVSPDGPDKSKCYAMRKAVRDRCLDAYTSGLDMLPATIVKSGKRENGYSLGCALCQCGVPCEGCIPGTLWREQAKNARCEV